MPDTERLPRLPEELALGKESRRSGPHSPPVAPSPWKERSQRWKRAAGAALTVPLWPPSPWKERSQRWKRAAGAALAVPLWPHPLGRRGVSAGRETQAQP